MMLIHLIISSFWEAPGSWGKKRDGRKQASPDHPSAILLSASSRGHAEKHPHCRQQMIDLAVNSVQILTSRQHARCIPSALRPELNGRAQDTGLGASHLHSGRVKLAGKRSCHEHWPNKEQRAGHLQQPISSEEDWIHRPATANRRCCMQSAPPWPRAASSTWTAAIRPGAPACPAQADRLAAAHRETKTII